MQRGALAKGSLRKGCRATSETEGAGGNLWQNLNLGLPLAPSVTAKPCHLPPGGRLIWVERKRGNVGIVPYDSLFIKRQEQAPALRCNVGCLIKLLLIHRLRGPPSPTGEGLKAPLPKGSCQRS